MSTDQLIKNLSKELNPVKRMRHPLIRVLPWMFVALLYMALIDYFYLGVRPDITAKLSDSFFLFEFGMALFMAFSASIAAAWLCIPDMRGQVWVCAVPLTLFATFAGWFAMRSLTEGVTVNDVHLNHCFHDGLVLITVPAAFMVFLSRGGATTRPIMMGVMNAIAIGAVGYAGLRLSCSEDNIAHGCFYHIAPFILLGGLVGLLARRIYRW